MTRAPLKAAAARPLAAAALAALLCGCISVFPKPTPVQMYRFGESAPPQPAAAPAAAPPMVLKGPTVFPPASGGDRILTVTGGEAAFIGGARWVAPASQMFDAALLRAFDAPGAPRLVQRGEPLAAPSALRLDVRSFEARYPGPTVVVQVRATLVRTADRDILAEKMFEVRDPASDNRQGAIVAAYDKAVAEVIGEVRDWTAASAPAQ